MAYLGICKFFRARFVCLIQLLSFVKNLTGGIKGGLHLTDVTNASRTMLMNLESLDWDPFLLK